MVSPKTNKNVKIGLVVLITGERDKDEPYHVDNG